MGQAVKEYKRVMYSLKRSYYGASYSSGSSSSAVPCSCSCFKM